MTTLDDKWHLMLLGARTLIGQLNEVKNGGDVIADYVFPTLSPVYQIEKRPTPVQGVDPNTGKQVQGMQMLWTIMSVAELDSITSIDVPAEAVLIPVAALGANDQKLLTELVGKIEGAREALARKLKVDADAAALANTSFGGGARQ